MADLKLATAPCRTRSAGDTANWPRTVVAVASKATIPTWTQRWARTARTTSAAPATDSMSTRGTRDRAVAAGVEENHFGGNNREPWDDQKQRG